MYPYYRDPESVCVDVVGERKEGRGEERRVGRRGGRREKEEEEGHSTTMKPVLTYPNFSYFVVLEGVLRQ